ncbi:MAG: DUF4494 domain-containing protein [Bacteroidaceae bacterium]|nr:DUF4494 domain-containing protein [Prevotellaceae bacterium]MDY5632182.1 DUF4494 domain-containing protein [Bacteroidaceae bacterium]
MNQWFECKVRFDKTMENGLIKKVTEPYLVEALTYTEAEARFLEEIEPFVKGVEFEVTDIKKARLSEIFFSNDGNDDRWFKARLAFITLDEKTGSEKRATQLVMVQAQDLRIAVKNIDTAMHGTLGDYLITSVQETNILDVIRYAVDSKDSEPEFKEA